MAGRLSARIVTILTPLPRQRVADRYGVAIASAVLAVVLRWLLDPVLGHVAFYVTLYVVVTFCAVVCGYAPAILSGLLGFLGIFYWFVDPRHSTLLPAPIRTSRHGWLLPGVRCSHRARRGQPP